MPGGMTGGAVKALACAAIAAAALVGPAAHTADVFARADAAASQDTNQVNADVAQPSGGWVYAPDGVSLDPNAA
ncbi:hypothetical protein [Streptacidiphilus jiangxiensis]|uniref:Uncharacterized protein n=1 Tax=Streptacidiphilus jiangxiensis TaxID=235985 RepID=A0A1H7TSH8_STRJI|nr:hypothetical protein [Streptacidiphilus jiangxiensis]SEL87548.1 hypothetical protein SAMN05414137_114170 [Streptacidiphilus jiangxiensis]